MASTLSLALVATVAVALPASAGPGPGVNIGLEDETAAQGDHSTAVGYSVTIVAAGDGSTVAKTETTWPGIATFDGAMDASQSDLLQPGSYALLIEPPAGSVGLTSGYWDGVDGISASPVAFAWGFDEIVWAVLDVSAFASPVSRYVAAVYRDLFGRSVDPSGQATWTTLLSTGTPRIAVANAITSSPEYRSTLVTGVYRDFLDRTPDPGGLGFWVDKMDQGWTVAQIASGFISSQEYYNAAGATADAWVAALYADVLDRGATPSEVGFWTDRLELGHSRAEIALGFLLSTERLQIVVTGYYALLLDRTPDSTGLAFWVAMLQIGTHDEEIIGGIVASDEYYNRA